jgi:hypothetical protein
MSEAARRLRKLEAEQGWYKPCPECGLTPGSEIEYRVEWEDEYTEAEIRQLAEWYERGMPVEELPPRYREPEPEKRCPRCGQVRETVTVWPEPPPGKNRAEEEAKFFYERPWEKYEAEFEEEQALKDSPLPDHVPESWGGGGHR